MNLRLLIINILLRLISCLVVNLVGLLLNMLIRLIGKQLGTSINIAAKIIWRWITRNRNLAKVGGREKVVSNKKLSQKKV